MSQISSFIFHTLNADGSVYGTGCFSYEGPPEGVDIQYNFGTSAGGTANKMLSFWYNDPMVGTLDINALINFNWTNGWQGAHYRFDFNLWNFPQNSYGLTAGQAQPNRVGPISGHRGNGDISGQKTLQWPTLAPNAQPSCCCQAFVEGQVIPGDGTVPNNIPDGDSTPRTNVIPDGGGTPDGGAIPDSSGTPEGGVTIPESLIVGPGGTNPADGGTPDGGTIPDSSGTPEGDFTSDPAGATSDESQISSFIFHTLNADGSVYGTGCFSYEGPPEGVDIQYNFGTSAGGTANKMLSFWYNDPMVGTLDINALINFNWTNGWQGAHYRFDFNLWNFPQNSYGLTAGQAQPNRVGPISGHRGNGDISGQKTLQWPTLAPATVTTGGGQATSSGTAAPTESMVIPQVDLVVVIDSSVSMKDEAAALSAAVDTAIEAARTSCPSDLRVTYLGIEGVFKETLFNRTVRDYLTGVGAAESDLRGRKRGTVAEGGAQEDGARAIEDVSLYFDWRANAARTVFFLGDEALEGGNENGKQDQADLEAATRAIDVASEAGVRVHTYLGTSGVKASVKQAIQGEYARVAQETGGQAFTSQDSISGFADLLKKVICGSKQPVKPLTPDPKPTTEPFCCCQAFVEGKTNPEGGGTPDGGVTIPEFLIVGPGGTNSEGGSTPDGDAIPDSSGTPEGGATSDPAGATSGGSQISSFIFHTLNADGSVYGTGCFSYEGPPEGVDIQYNFGTSAGGTANKMLSFWYHDPVVGTLDINALINFNWTNGWQEAHYRLDFNLWNFPQNSHGLTAGQAQPNRLGPISGHRGNGDISGQKTLQWPTLAPVTVTTDTPQSSSSSSEASGVTVIPQVDLVVVIDSSVSMKDEASALSAAVGTAIEAARTSCPSDLRVIYLGIEGIFKDTLFDQTVRNYLTGTAGALESDLRGRKRGTVSEGGAQEDGARAIEDVSLYFDWRANAARTVFFLGDEALEGGNENSQQDQADLEAATRAIDVASEAGVRVHTYLGTSGVKASVKQAIQGEYARVAQETGGQAFTSQDSISGFADLLKKVICGSKQPVKPLTPDPKPTTEPFCCCQAFVEAKRS